MIVYGPQLQEVARHRLLPRSATGQRCERAEDRRQSIRGSGRPCCANASPNWARRRSASWRVCCRASVTARTRPTACWRCWAPTPARDVLAALERAVRYGAYSLAAVERILAAQARPKDVWHRWPRKNASICRRACTAIPSVRVRRPTTNPLLPEEPANDGPTTETPATPTPDLREQILPTSRR